MRLPKVSVAYLDLIVEKRQNGFDLLVLVLHFELLTFLMLRHASAMRIAEPSGVNTTNTGVS
jgi:hypothetical protein